jgi:3-oxosteroid 1-dehydrogenase
MSRSPSGMDDTIITEEVDFLVIGSGAGGLTAAIRAHDLGLKTLVIEKSRYYGGTSAMSDGSIWIPNNHLMTKAGVPDSEEEALTYLKALTRGDVAEDRLLTFIRKGADMLRYLETHSDLSCTPLPEYSDYYYPAKPGSKPGARTLEARRFLTLRLGRELLRLRPPHPGCLTFGFIHLTAKDAYHAVRGQWQAHYAVILGVLLYLLAFPLRLFAPRSTRVTLGNALVAPLRLSLKKRGVPLWLESPARQLLTEGNRVVGATVHRAGKPVNIRVRKAVLLASGGFEHDPALRQQHLPSPTSTDWSAGCKHNTGDALYMTAKLNPQLALMDDAWWSPGATVPGSPYGHVMVFEKSMPRSLFVNSKGERFTNEAAPYIDVVNAMYANHQEEERQAVPCWMVFDARYRSQIAVAGTVYPSSMMPDSILPERYWNRLLYKSDTLAGLAHQIGVDAQQLQTTVTRYNRFAETGIDEDFSRGSTPADRYYSGGSGGPNPHTRQTRPHAFLCRTNCGR